MVLPCDPLFSNRIMEEGSLRERHAVLSTEAIGWCNPSLALCPKCPSDVYASSWEYSSRFSWGLSLFCSRCDSMWMVCRKCSKLRNRFLSGSEMLRHNKARHGNDSRPSPSSRPSSSVRKRSIAEVEKDVAAVALPPFPDVLPAVAEDTGVNVDVDNSGGKRSVAEVEEAVLAVALPPFPDVLPAVSDVQCAYGQGNRDAAYVPDYVTLPAALSCSLFGKSMLDDAVFHGLDYYGCLFDGLIHDNSFLTFPAGYSKGGGALEEEEDEPIIVTNSSVGVLHCSPSPHSSKSVVLQSSNNAVSSLLLLAADGLNPRPASPPESKFVLLPYVFEVPPYDADTAVVVTHPEYLSSPLFVDSGTFFIPSIANDEFIRRFEHRIMVIKVPRFDIIEQFYGNMEKIPESKFHYISETELKQFTFERDYGTICGSQGMLCRLSISPGCDPVMGDNRAKQ
jgi:hypothetical protein